MKLINICAHTYKYTLLTGLLFVQYLYQLGLLKQFSKISNLSHWFHLQASFIPMVVGISLYTKEPQLTNDNKMWGLSGPLVQLSLNTMYLSYHEKVGKIVHLANYFCHCNFAHYNMQWQNDDKMTKFLPILVKYLNQRYLLLELSNCFKTKQEQI